MIMKIYSVDEVEGGHVTKSQAFNMVAELLMLYVEQNAHPGLVGGMFFGSIFTKPSPGSDLNCALVYDESKALGISERFKNLEEIARQNGVSLKLHTVPRSSHGDVVVRNASEVALWKSLCITSKRYAPFRGGAVFSSDRIVSYHNDERMVFAQYLNYCYKRNLVIRGSFHYLESDEKNNTIGEMVCMCHVLLKLLFVAVELLDLTASKKEVCETGKIYALHNERLLSLIVQLEEMLAGYQETLSDFSDEPTNQEKKLRYVRVLDNLQEKSCTLTQNLLIALMNEVPVLV